MTFAVTITTMETEGLQPNKRCRANLDKLSQALGRMAGTMPDCEEEMCCH